MKNMTYFQIVTLRHTHGPKFKRRCRDPIGQCSYMLSVRGRRERHYQLGRKRQNFFMDSQFSKQDSVLKYLRILLWVWYGEEPFPRTEWVSLEFCSIGPTQSLDWLSRRLTVIDDYWMGSSACSSGALGEYSVVKLPWPLLAFLKCV